MPSIKVAHGISLVQKHLATRGDASWWMRVKRKDFRDGRQTFERLGEDLEEAKASARILAAKLERMGEKRGAAPQLLVSELLWSWHNEYGSQMARSTRLVAANNIRRHLEPALGELPVTLLTKPRLWEYAQAKHESGDLATNSILSTLSNLRTACNLLWEGEIEKYADWMPPSTPSGRCPSKRISGVMQQVEREFVKGTREPYTRQEAEILLKLAQDRVPKLFPLLRLGFGAGMRIGEILGMRWSNVDLEQGLVHVREQLTRGVVSRTKTRTDRVAVLPPGVLEMMRRLRAVARPSAVFVFESENLIPLSYKTTNNWFAKLAEIAYSEHGIPKGRTFHSTRHTYATEAVHAGVPDKWREMQAGHSGKAADAYLHIDPARRPDLSWAEFGLGVPEASQGVPEGSPLN